MRMRTRSSWNFSTAIFEIWVLVLTKPGWANETPTTSLRVAEYPEVHHQHHYRPHHENPHYPLEDSSAGENEEEDRSSGSGKHHLFHSSHYYSNSNSNNNRHHQHHYLPHHHHNHHHNQHQHNHHYSPHLQRNNHHHNLLESASSSSSSSFQEEPLALASSYYSSQFSIHNSHRCYVCLPPNKNSREAQQILDIFANEVRPRIPDCKDFDPYVDTGRFEFDCPPKYGGCLLRIHGANVSRACSKYRYNDCKKANSVEFCYCTTPLCNDKKPEPLIIPPAVVQHVSRRRGSSSNGNKSPLRGRTTTGNDDDDETEEGNSQGIRSRTRISSSSSLDEEIILHRHHQNQDEVDVDDEDINGGSGEEADEENYNHNHRDIHSFIDPSFTSTMDPFHEENGNGVGVDVEDPNPHTKIGISMTASTSGSSSSGGATALKPNSFSLVHSSVFHLFLYLVQRTLLLSPNPNPSENQNNKLDYYLDLDCQTRQTANFSKFHHHHHHQQDHAGDILLPSLKCRDIDSDCPPTPFLQSRDCQRTQTQVKTQNAPIFPFSHFYLCIVISSLMVIQVLFS